MMHDTPVADGGTGSSTTYVYVLSQVPAYGDDGYVRGVYRTLERAWQARPTETFRSNRAEDEWTSRDSLIEKIELE